MARRGKELTQKSIRDIIRISIETVCFFESMRYRLNLRPRHNLAVPAQVSEFLSEAGEAELKVLLYAAKDPTFSDRELIDGLSDTLDPEQVREAIAFWRGAGIFSKETAKKSPAAKTAEPENAKTDARKTVRVVSERPNYTSAQLALAVEENADFKSLIDYAEHRLQKNFNASDLSLLYSFVDRLGLPVEVVMLAIESCAGEGKKNLRYIEKLLIDLADREIDDLEKADAYFKRREEYLSFEGQIRAMCGFGTRTLTAREQELLTVWREEWKVSDEELKDAYERTIRAINKPSLAYMNRILATLREAKDRVKTASGKLAAGEGKTYDLDDFFASAVERTKRNRKKSGQEGEPK